MANETLDEKLLCIPFSEEQFRELKKYADLNGMEIVDFLKNVCLTACLQEMEQQYERKPTQGKAPAEDRELREKPQEKTPSVKQLLDGPLVLDAQCIRDLYLIKKERPELSNNQLILLALKLGLNQLNVALDLAKTSFQK